MPAPDPFWLGVGATVLVVIGVGSWLENRGPQPGTIAHVDQLYREGEISLQEMSRRKDVLQDPRADRIREEVERVSGIGEQTSWDLAAEFESVDEVADADRERLEQVPNVGPERAQALDERFE